MSSDSSDDEFDSSLIRHEEESCNVHIGLEVQSFDFKRGDKGRLTTTHCHPRKLHESPFCTLASKMQKTEKELGHFIADYKNVLQKNKDTADGILMGLLSTANMSKNEAIKVFKIGSGRWARLYNKLPAKQEYGKNHMVSL